MIATDACRQVVLSRRKTAKAGGAERRYIAASARTSSTAEVNRESDNEGFEGCSGAGIVERGVGIGARGDFRSGGADRRAQRHLRHLSGHQWHGFGGSGADGRGGFQRRRQEYQGRDRLRRPPEQGRCRLGDRAQMARRRRRRRGRRRAQFGGGSHYQFAAARFADDVSRLVHREFGSDRQGLLAEHHPVGQRRLGDRQHHGGCDDGSAAAPIGTFSR